MVRDDAAVGVASELGATRVVGEAVGIGVARSGVDDGVAGEAAESMAGIWDAVALEGRPVFAEPEQPMTKPMAAAHAATIRHTAEPPIVPSRPPIGNPMTRFAGPLPQ